MFVSVAAVAAVAAGRQMCRKKPDPQRDFGSAVTRLRACRFTGLRQISCVKTTAADEFLSLAG
jgi:hypothetical protein